MLHKPRLLDLFCGAGGAGMGYHRAGFDVVGVDIRPMPRYPFEFHQADALVYLAEHGHEFDAIHASPPCQGYSRTRHLPNARENDYPMLIDATRKALIKTGKPYIIENVETSPLNNPITLCGTMFGLRVIRHRLFETNPPIYFRTPCQCKDKHTQAMGRHGKLGIYQKEKKGFITVAGKTFRTEVGAWAMSIDWMTRDELSQAIPPAYTEFIGKQLMQVFGCV